MKSPATNMAEPFYRSLGDGRFLATRTTESPWDKSAQHGGPPSALMARTMNDLNVADGGGHLRIARIAVEFLGTIPRGEVEVEARIVRPGGRIKMLEAEMHAGGRSVAMARAWAIVARTDDAVGTALAAAAATGRGAEDDGDRTAGPSTDPMPVPDPQPQLYFGGSLVDWGYGEAIDWRWTRGGYVHPGPGTVWTRVLNPFVDDQPPTPLERALIVADSANGISGVLPYDEWMFVPPGMVTTLHRHPVGEWVVLSAESTVADDGIGSTVGTLSDVHGTVGSVTQPLYVGPRPG